MSGKEDNIIEEYLNDYIAILAEEETTPLSGNPDLDDQSEEPQEPNDGYEDHIENGKMVVKVVRKKDQDSDPRAECKLAENDDGNLDKILDSPQSPKRKGNKDSKKRVEETITKKAFQLPKSWERNISKLNKISDFVEDNKLDCIIDPQYVNKEFDDTEFKELTEIVMLLNRICEDIDNIDNGLITHKNINRPATAMNRIIKLSNNYIEL